MRTEINEKTGLPAIVTMVETIPEEGAERGGLAVFTFCEDYPDIPWDFSRDGLTHKQYCMSVGAAFLLVPTDKLRECIELAHTCTSKELVDEARTLINDYLRGI